MTTTRNISTLQSAAFALLLDAALTDAEVRALETKIAERKPKSSPFKLTFVELTPPKPERPKALDCMSDLLRLFAFHGLTVPHYNFNFKDAETLVVTVPSANFYEFVRDIRELKSITLSRFIVVQTWEKNAFGVPIDSQRWPLAAKSAPIPAPPRTKPACIDTFAGIKELMRFYGITAYSVEEGYTGLMPLVHVKVPDFYVYQVKRDLDALLPAYTSKKVTGNGSRVQYPAKITHREDLRQLAYACGFHTYDIKQVDGNIHHGPYYVLRVPHYYLSEVNAYVKTYSAPGFRVEVGIL